MIVLTKERIGQMRTANGGFTRATIEALGVQWPLQAGWLKQIEGTKISNETWDDAVKARSHGMNHRFRGNA